MTKINLKRSNIDSNFPLCRPSLDLDFTQSQLDERITFTRSTKGSRVNKNRLIEIVPENQPRFDHDPITGECKGLLIEDVRTNVLPYSDRLDITWLVTVSGGSGTFIDGETVTSSINSLNGTYVASLSTSTIFAVANASGQPFGVLTGSLSGATRNITNRQQLTATYNSTLRLTTETLAPDGSQNACIFNATTSGNQLRNTSKPYITSSYGNYTFSFFCKNKNIYTNRVALSISENTGTLGATATFDLSTKTWLGTSVSSWTLLDYGYQDYSNGWVRLWITVTANSGTYTYIAGVIWPGGFSGIDYANAGSMYFWGTQFESGTFLTSYISTDISSGGVSRDSDVVSLSGTNFSSWYNQLEGTMVSSYIVRVPSTSYSNHADFAVLNADGSNKIVGWANDTKAALVSVIYSNTTVFLPTINALGYAVNIPIKKAVSVKDKSMIACVNGVVYSSVLGFIDGYQTYLANDFNRMFIGGEGYFAQALDGTIARLTYYPKALSANQLQLLTQ